MTSIKVRLVLVFAHIAISILFGIWHQNFYAGACAFFTLMFLFILVEGGRK